MNSTALPLDHDSAAFLADPAAVYRDAAAAHWYADGPFGPVVLRHADVDARLRDPRLRPLGLDLMLLQGVDDGPLHDWWSRIMFSATGDDHVRLRRLVGRAFTPRAVDALRPTFAAITTELAERAEATGPPVDAVATVGRLPVRAMCALLGVPAADVDVFRDWSTDLALAFGFGVAEERARVEAAVVNLCGYVDDLLARTTPGDGSVLATLLAAADDGDRLSRQECVAMVVNLILAGTDTTSMQLSWALHRFCEHPDQWRALSADDGLAPRAVSEVLRHAPAVAGAPRVVTSRLTVHECTFEVGELLSLSFLSANRDPDVFADPDRFDVTRSPGAALSFGHGAHYCLGASLARAELEVALPLLARRWPALAAAGEPQWRPFVGVWGAGCLPVTW